MIHLVNPKNEVWYHLDEKNRVWTCPCKSSTQDKVSLCLTIDESLAREGELRELGRLINDRRKQLGLKINELMP